MRALRSFVVTVVAFVVLAAPAVVLADGRVALVVGNSTYAHIRRLPNAENDARDMSAALRRLGFQVTTEFDADRVALSEALRTFTRRSLGADVALVFYAEQPPHGGGRTAVRRTCRGRLNGQASSASRRPVELGQRRLGSFAEAPDAGRSNRRPGGLAGSPRRSSVTVIGSHHGKATPSPADSPTTGSPPSRWTRRPRPAARPPNTATTRPQSDSAPNSPASLTSHAASGDRTTSVRQLLRRRPPWYALAPDEKRREAANRRQRPRSIPRLLDHHVDVSSSRRSPRVQMPVHVHATFRNVAKRQMRQEQLGAARHVQAGVDLIETLNMSAGRAVELMVSEDQHLPARRHPKPLQTTARETADRDIAQVHNRIRGIHHPAPRPEQSVVHLFRAKSSFAVRCGSASSAFHFRHRPARIPRTPRSPSGVGRGSTLHHPE